MGPRAQGQYRWIGTTSEPCGDGHHHADQYAREYNGADAGDIDVARDHTLDTHAHCREQNDAIEGLALDGFCTDAPESRAAAEQNDLQQQQVTEPTPRVLRRSSEDLHQRSERSAEHEAEESCQRARRWKHLAARERNSEQCGIASHGRGK